MKAAAVTRQVAEEGAPGYQLSVQAQLTLVFPSPSQSEGLGQSDDGPGGADLSRVERFQPAALVENREAEACAPRHGGFTAELRVVVVGDAEQHRA